MSLRLLNFVTTATIVLFLFGFAIRVYFAATQPFWLDEQFSLFFSQEYVFSKLLFFFSNDVHPGLYYSVVKVISVFSPSNFVVRLVTSVLPEVIGFGVLAKTLILINTHFFKISKREVKTTNTYLLFIFTLLYFLNPFIIDQSWQIRMYGIVLLLSSAALYFFTRYIKDKKIKNLVYVFIICITGMAASYTFFLFTFSLVSLLIVWVNTKISKKIFLFMALLTFLVGYFFLLSGYSGRGQIEYANWISHPNIKNIPSTYTTLFGFGRNLHATVTNNMYQLFLDYSILFSSLYLFFYILKVSSFFLNSTFTTKTHKRIIQELYLALFIFPFAVILLGSFLLPFLSKRFFFHTFVPNISLFLPRIHTIFLPLFWIVLSIVIFRLFSKLHMMNLHKTIQIIVPILSVFLLLSIYITTIGSIYTLRLETAAAHTELKKSHEESELIFPEWIHYLDISDTTYLTTHSQLASQIATSKKISTDILSDNQNCSATQEKSFALFTAFFTKNNEKEKLISYYETCCPEDKKITTNSVLLCK